LWEEKRHGKEKKLSETKGNWFIWTSEKQLAI
jgi:hypothetical protein